MGNKRKNNADSPVLFLIYDLTNRWVDINNDGRYNRRGLGICWV